MAREGPQDAETEGRWSRRWARDGGRGIVKAEGGPAAMNATGKERVVLQCPAAAGQPAAAAEEEGDRRRDRNE